MGLPGGVSYLPSRQRDRCRINGHLSPLVWSDHYINLLGRNFEPTSQNRFQLSRLQLSAGQVVVVRTLHGDSKGLTHIFKPFSVDAFDASKDASWGLAFSNYTVSAHQLVNPLDMTIFAQFGNTDRFPTRGITRTGHHTTDQQIGLLLQD